MCINVPMNILFFFFFDILCIIFFGYLIIYNVIHLFYCGWNFRQNKNFKLIVVLIWISEDLSHPVSARKNKPEAKTRSKLLTVRSEISYNTRSSKTISSLRITEYFLNLLYPLHLYKALYKIEKKIKFIGA